MNTLDNAPWPDYPKSKLITGVKLDKYRYHKGDGDMWPITWADDDSLYGAAGDNHGSPMNLYRIVTDEVHPWDTHLWLVNNMPVDPGEYCRVPGSDRCNSVKPAGLLCMDATFHLAVECMNYGDNPAFNRQHNLNGWIITSSDHGVTWDCDATRTDFFTGRLASCHFVQFGRDYAGARDSYVYAYFPGVGDDGQSYWENGDYIILGRVPRDELLDRGAWEFFVGHEGDSEARWHSDDAEAASVFRYPLMTGEDHVSYNAGIGRYILGNYSFLDQKGSPRPLHQKPYPQAAERSQLTLFEAPEPWGPWSLFYRDDNWGTYGGYQPVFPTKLMSGEGTKMVMVSSGTFDDYNFTSQHMALQIAVQG